jgi:hypothetical protein
MINIAEWIYGAMIQANPNEQIKEYGLINKKINLEGSNTSFAHLYRKRLCYYLCVLNFGLSSLNVFFNF